MKIVHICQKFAPDKGGVETHVQQVARQQLAQGHQVQVIAMASQTAQFNWQGIEVTKIKAGSKFEIWQQIWLLRAEITESDFVHIHDVGWWLVWLWPLIRDRSSLTFHGWEGQWPVRWQAKVHRWIMAQLFRPTLHIGGWIQQFYWDRPDLVSYGGVSKNQIVKYSKDSFDCLHTKKLQIVFVGRLEPENMITEYAKLVKSLQKSGWQVRMTWVGDGSLHDLAETVGTVTGMLEKQAVISQIDQAHVVAANSYLSMWEAMSRGKLVIALAQHPLKVEYLRTFPASESLLIGQTSQEIISLLSTLNSKECQRRSDHALTITKNHTWQDVAKQYDQLRKLQK